MAAAAENLFGNSVFDPAMKHEAAHGQIDEGFGDLGLAFVVPAQAPGAAQPAEGAFDHPASGDDDKALCLVGTPDNLDIWSVHVEQGNFELVSCITTISEEMIDLATRARDGKLKPHEYQGGTFSISNGGVFGSMLSTPIINPPQSAILGVHATKDRAVVENGQIVVRPMNYLAMSYDHRIIDGSQAVRFLVKIKQMLEDPARLLLEV